MKTHKMTFGLLFCLVLFCFSSCSDNLSESVDQVNLSSVDTDQTESDYWTTIFEGYWQDMSYYYIFWDEEEDKSNEYQVESGQESVDWDALYDEYSEKFDDIATTFAEDTEDITYQDDPSEYLAALSERNIAALIYFYEMQEHLIDHHYYMYLKNVVFNPDDLPSEEAAVLTYSDTPQSIMGATDYKWYSSVVLKTPAMVELEKRDEYNANYANFDMQSYVYDTIVSSENTPSNVTSISDVQYYSEDSTIADSSFVIISCLINETIPYLYLSSFSLYDYYDECEDVVDNFYDLVYSSFIDVSQIIFDFRHNGGGYIADLSLVAGDLLSSSDSVTYAYTRNKSEINRLSYTNYIPATLIGTRESGESLPSCPIIVLDDIGSASMSEVTTLALKAIAGDNFVQMGQRTYGANGGIVGSSSTVLSSIDSNDYYYIYTPSTATYDTDYENHEGYGYAPTDGYDVGANPLEVDSSGVAGVSSDSMLSTAVGYEAD